MKIIKHKHGKEIFNIYEIELDCNHKLRIVPGEITDSSFKRNDYVLQVICPSHVGAYYKSVASIPRGKMRELQKAVDEAIREIKKAKEFKTKK